VYLWLRYRPQWHAQWLSDVGVDIVDGLIYLVAMG